MSKNKRISGTLEWAKFNANCIKGCKNSCLYCYARYSAIYRFKSVKTEKEWENEIVDTKKLSQKWTKKDGTIMFPSCHDISPENIDTCISFLKNILKPGNDVLIVSKPHLECVKKMCEALKEYKEHILFRFTIGAYDNKILRFWEPNAPTFGERYDSLQYAFGQGFSTSISVEPMLDADNVGFLFDTLSPYVSDSIWIGKMNKTAQRVKTFTMEEKNALKRIEISQTDEKIWKIYEMLKDEPKIKWKESIKEVVGLDLAKEAGLDE